MNEVGHGAACLGFVRAARKKSHFVFLYTAGWNPTVNSLLSRPVLYKKNTATWFQLSHVAFLIFTLSVHVNFTRFGATTRFWNMRLASNSISCTSVTIRMFCITRLKHFNWPNNQVSSRLRDERIAYNMLLIFLIFLRFLICEVLWRCYLKIN